MESLRSFCFIVAIILIYVSQYNQQTVLQHNIYSYIFKDGYMLWPLKMVVIGVYIKIGKNAIFKTEIYSLTYQTS